MKKFIILVLISSLLNFSCGDDDEMGMGEVELNFRLTYGDQPMAMLDENTYVYPQSDMRFYLSRMSFFLSNISFSGSESHSNEEIRMIHFDSRYADPQLASEGIPVVLDNVPSGDYNRFRFSIGVPQEENGMTPNEFQSSSPLSNTGDYWEPWNSYIFVKAEGRLDTDMSEPFELPFTLHTGSDQAFLNFDFTGDIEVHEGERTTVIVNIDMRRFFGGEEDPYDILTTPNIHRLDQLEQTLEITANLGNSVRARILSPQ